MHRKVSFTLPGLALLVAVLVPVAALVVSLVGAGACVVFLAGVACGITICQRSGALDASPSPSVVRHDATGASSPRVVDAEGGR